MPWIVRKGKRSKNKSYNTQKRREVYDSSLWKRMRLAHLRDNALCEVCLLQDKVTLAEAVHHLKTFMGAETKEERDQLAYDSENFCSVCPTCHNRIHNGDLKGCESLDQIKARLEEINNSNN